MSGNIEELKTNRIKYNVGQLIGASMYLGDIKSDKDRKALFVCECGKLYVAWIHSVKSGVTKSCGCYRKKYMTNKQTKHGLSRHPLYNVYGNMIERCYNKNSISYVSYGARGVRVCEQWRNSFVLFYSWCMNNGWSDKLQLDKDFKGDGLSYSPETCCFVTPKINSNKRRTSKYITFKKETKTIAQWSDIYKISQGTLSFRLKNGWSVIDALNIKVNKSKHYDRSR